MQKQIGKRMYLESSKLVNRILEIDFENLKVKWKRGFVKDLIYNTNINGCFKEPL